jgi:hypothetical protein
MFETGKLTLQYHDNVAEIDLTFLVWVFGALVALILLIIVSRVLRNLFAGRVRRIQEFGMDFDSVSAMLDKGLLTSDEAKRVKSVLTRHFSRLYEQRFAGPSAGGLAALAESEAAVLGDAAKSAPRPSARQPLAGAQHAAPTPAPPASKPAQPVAAPAPSAAASEVQPDEATVELPLDVLDMYRAGMITDDEMVALRRFYAARARESK